MSATAAVVLPRVHVLLLNWNGWRDTVECLESVFRLDYPDVRVIVCDNASTDGSLDHIEQWARGTLCVDPPPGPLRTLSDPPVRKPIKTARLGRDAAESGELGDAPLVLIDTGGNAGFAAGNNVALRGLLAAGASGYVWFLNNDMVVAPDALRRLVEVCQRDPAVGAAGATLLEYSEPDVVQTVVGGVLRRWQGMPRETKATGLTVDRLPEVPPRVDFVSGGCLLTPVAVLGRVGLLDERFFMYGEDIDWSLRLRALGYEIAWASGARAWHKDGRSSRPGSPFHDYQMVRSALLLVRSRFPGFLPFAMVHALYKCVLPKLIRGERERLAAAWRAWSSHLSFAPLPAPAADAPRPVPRHDMSDVV